MNPYPGSDAAARPAWAVAALLFSATLWGVLWYPLRLLEGQGLAGLWSSLVLYGAAGLVGLPVLWRLRGVMGRRPGGLLVLALASGWTNIAFILAVLEGQVVRVMLLFFLSPLWTVLLGRLLLGERPNTAARLTLLLAMAGAVVMLWDPALGLPWPRSEADWLALSAGFTFALANVLVRRLAELPVGLKAVSAWWGVVLLAGLLIAGQDLPLPQVTAGVWAAAAALGGVGIVVMTLAVVYGVSHMPVHRSAVILLFELVAGAVSSQWLTDEVVLPREWAGGALIVLAGWFAARASLTAGPEGGRRVSESG